MSPSPPIAAAHQKKQPGVLLQMCRDFTRISRSLSICAACRRAPTSSPRPMREIQPRISIRCRLSESRPANRAEVLGSGRKSIASEFNSGIGCWAKDEARPQSRIANSRDRVATTATHFRRESVASVIVNRATDYCTSTGDVLEESGPIPHGSAHWPAAKKFVGSLSQIAPIVPVLPTLPTRK